MGAMRGSVLPGRLGLSLISFYKKCYCGQGESASTLVLTVKTQLLEIDYFWKFDTKFGFKSIELTQWAFVFNQQGQE
jgi:hypothetical protein